MKGHLSRSRSDRWLKVGTHPFGSAQPRVEIFTSEISAAPATCTNLPEEMIEYN